MTPPDSQDPPNSGIVQSRLIRATLYTIVVVLALGCAVLGGMRLLLPQIQHLRPEIEAWASDIFEREVRFGAIDAYWHGWTPVLRVMDVRLADGATADQGDGDSPLRLAEVSFSIDPVASLRFLSLQPFDIAARGASVIVVRNVDGTLSLHGLGETSAAEPHRGSRFVAWALAQSRLSLLDSRVDWIDRRSGSHEITLDDVTLHLRREGDGYRFSGSFGLPDAGGVEFVVDVSGDPLSPSWTGAAYARLHDVELQSAGLDARRLGGDGFTGRVSGEVWSTWSRDGIIEAEGTVRAELPGIVQRDVRRGVDELNATFRIGQAPEGWELSVRDLVVVTPRGEWPRTSVGVRWTAPRQSEDGIIVVNADHARIGDLVAVVAHDGNATANSDLNALIAAAPHGALEDLHVSVPITDRLELGRARARGRFVDLWLGLETNPISVEAASGQFEASAQGLVADVETGTLQLNLPRRFAHPLRGEDLTGALAVLPTPEGLRFRFEGVNTTTPTGTMAAHGWGLAPRDRSGLQLDITVEVGPARFAAAQALLAGRMLPESVARWLENAASDGDILGTRLRIRSRSPGKTATSRGPSVEATADLAFPSFRYARGWPELVNASGRLMWRDGRRLEAQVESGRILDSNVRTASIIVSDLNADVPEVEVRARIDGASMNVIRFLTESPLRSRFARAFDGWTIRGDSTTEFGLKLRFKPGETRGSVGGEVSLANNRVRIPALSREFEAVSGVVGFGDATVESDGLTAIWHGEPLRAVIGPTPEPDSAGRLSIEGRLTRRILAEVLHDAGLADSPRTEDSPMLALLDGDTAVEVAIDIPRARKPGRGWLLSAVTGLDGIAVDLPPPFGKSRESERELAIESTIAADSESVVRARYGDVASAALGLIRDAGQFRVERGMVRFDAQPAAIPDTEGITVHGALPTLDSRAWLDVVRKLTAGAEPGADSSPFDRVREWSISADSVVAAGASFPETAVRARQDTAGGWKIRVSGRNLEGSVHIPPDLQAAPISAELDRLVFVPHADGTRPGSAGLDPRKLPGLSLSAGRVVLGDYDLGAVRLATVPSEDGLDVTSIELETDGFRGDGTGRWSTGDSGHRTELDVRIHGDDLGKMLDTLGFDGSTVQGGVTDVSVNGAWPGTPGSFTPGSLRGVIRLHSTDGNLTQIKRGVPGRVFGLITFTSLPRRLLLDFGDLFSSGIEFDLIEGSFALENGNAYTEDLVMESDTARIEVVGRTGLVSQDYDKLVTVTPKISSSLPLVPIWVLQKILDRNVFDKAFAYQYTIAGPWNDPAIELVRTERLPESGDE